MKLKQALIGKEYRAQFDAIVEAVLQHPEIIPELLKADPEEDFKLPPHLSHVLAIVAEEGFKKLMPYREELIEYMFQHAEIEAVVRNILRIIKVVGVPSPYEGKMVDFCFRKLSSFPTAVAIKVHCMMILLRLCKDEAELLGELKLIIEEFMPHGSAAFKSRGSKTIEAIEEMIEG